jgi:hypothetical protein
VKLYNVEYYKKTLDDEFKLIGTQQFFVHDPNKVSVPAAAFLNAPSLECKSASKLVIEEIRGNK